MPLGTFSTNELALVKGIKLDTIRANAGAWEKKYKAYLKAIRDNNPPHYTNDYKHALHWWWKRPYVEGAYKLGIATKWELELIEGRAINHDLAVKDGFLTRMNLIVTLGCLNKMSYKEITEHTWAHLSWEWYDGPFLPEQYDFLIQIGHMDAYRAYKEGDLNWRYRGTEGWRE